MEDTEIISLWKAQHIAVEQSLTTNKQLLKEAINHKTQLTLQSSKRLKIIGIIVSVFYLFILGNLLFYSVSHYSSALNYFIVSFTAIYIINIKALSDYIRHLVFINNINYNGTITEIQQKLAKLQMSIIQHTRIIWLQLPFWTTFYVSNIWFPQSTGRGYFIFQIVLTGSFAFIAYWLYRNMNIKNIDKRWFQILIAASGGKSVAKALNFYKEIEAYKHVK